MKKDFTKTTIAIVLILLAVFSRLLPHPPNFTAVGAIAIFGAITLPSRWLTILATVVAMWLSDVIINNVIYSSHSFVLFTKSMLWIYSAIICHSLFSWMLNKRSLLLNVTISSLLGAISFFIITNLGVFLSSGMYPQDWNGLVFCFTAALPFFGNVLLGNLFFSGVLFGIYYLIEKRMNVLQNV